MITIASLRQARARLQSRKRGADMTNALLWSAFFMVVLISLFAMYQVVTLNSNKTTSTRTLSMASNEARTLYRNADSFTGLNAERLIAAGAVPTDATNGTDTITLPYGGTVEFAATADRKFTATVEFENTGLRARNLCTFLSTGPQNQVISGPMGSEYSIGTRSCSSTDSSFVVTYER